MKRLLKIAGKEERLIIGLMSGTSHDGVDAALVSIKGNGIRTRVNLLHYLHYPYPAAIKKKIERAFEGCTEDICRLNFDLGEIFARTALECIGESEIPKDDLDIIASHGQTIHHIPPREGTSGSTLQVGEADVIAERTGIVTISDFRKRDMAVGGQGAPLVPYADFLLFREEGKTRASQNIGGIANVTLVTEEAENVKAFDTGPGNALLDEAVKILSAGEKDFDMDGAWAQTGDIDRVLLNRLMSHPYLEFAPPKSTGRETFGKKLVEEIITGNPSMLPEDLLATLTSFTARSIHRAYEDFILTQQPLDEIIVSGGGCKNRYLFSLLSDAFKKTSVTPIEELEIPCTAKEAISFAILANETVTGMPGNLPSATGAAKYVVLGKISL